MKASTKRPILRIGSCDCDLERISIDAAGIQPECLSLSSFRVQARGLLIRRGPPSAAEFQGLGLGIGLTPPAVELKPRASRPGGGSVCVGGTAIRRGTHGDVTRSGPSRSPNARIRTINPEAMIPKEHRRLPMSHLNSA